MPSESKRDYAPVATSSTIHSPRPSRGSTSQSAALLEGPYHQTGRSTMTTSITEKFSLPADPANWGIDMAVNHPEPDDFLHNPDPRRDKGIDRQFALCNPRALANLGCLLILALGIFALFAGYPLASWLMMKTISTGGGFNIGGINASGQIPEISGSWGLIDKDTPKSVYTKASLDGRGDLQLVFSDEFNVDGRTFWPGDDPYWEAVDLHYWGTNNMEWYSPQQLTTKNGSLEISLVRKDSHNRNYEGGMMSTWNKFCFTGGLLEAAVVLPGSSNVQGLWPAFWTMGNLGRAGYGASLDGMWPYSYDECDVGTLPNQTMNGIPVAATQNGDSGHGGALSFLPGQKLSRCTCAGESHPGPVHRDGTYVGRAAPEIDVFEAQVTGHLEAEVSQSGQWAPFNAEYTWFNTTENLEIYDAETSFLNPYKGGVYQQASSVTTYTNENCYQFGGTGCFSVYGIEYKPGFDDAYISWVSDNKRTWTIRQGGMAADTRVEIGPRPVPQEPLYILLNLGMSENFGTVDLENLIFPAIMKVDYVRVYQHPDQINLGCDPPEFPTKAYIEEYIEAYTNPNLTTWIDDYKKPFPKNKLLDQC